MIPEDSEPIVDAVRFLTPTEVVNRWRSVYSEKTLANWRAQRSGPNWTRIGGRILYPLPALERFEQSRTRRGRRRA